MRRIPRSQVKVEDQLFDQLDIVGQTVADIIEIIERADGEPMNPRRKEAFKESVREIGKLTYLGAHNVRNRFR